MKKMKAKQKIHTTMQGAAGNAILYLIILTGIVIIGVMFLGSAVPTGQMTNRNDAVVTILPDQDTASGSSLQLKTFPGITGLPTNTPTP